MAANPSLSISQNQSEPVARLPDPDHNTGARGPRWWRWGIPAVLMLIVAAAIAFRHSSTSAAAGPIRLPASIACLGRFEPEDGVRVIAARSLSGQPSLVGELRVREGELVQAGQVLAVLNSNNELRATLRQAEANVELARKRLAQVKAGAKTGDIAAQRAEISKTEVELRNAQVEYTRAQALYEQGITSKAEFDLRRVALESQAQLLQQAREKLASLAEVRGTDVEVAEAEVAAAVAARERASAEYEASVVRSPILGRVIKINVRPGEEVGANGIMEVGDTRRMYVTAEVPDTDIRRVQRGYHAVITAESLAAALSGTVQEVGFKVGRNELVHTDPAALSDARVVEVKIRLDDGRAAEHLTHAQARVLIRP